MDSEVIPEPSDIPTTSQVVHVEETVGPPVDVIGEPVLYANGDSFTGQVMVGIRTGFGKYVYANGDVYNGYFVDDKKQGIGKLEYCCSIDVVPPQCSYYHGEFEGGIFAGGGTYRYSNGDVYSGHWSEGRKHGHGVYYYANDGGSLEGAWSSGEFISGEWTLPNGNVFTGCFNSGKPLGKGNWQLIDGTTVHGEYVNDSWKFTLS